MFYRADLRRVPNSRSIHQSAASDWIFVAEDVVLTVHPYVVSRSLPRKLSDAQRPRSVSYAARHFLRRQLLMAGTGRSTGASSAYAARHSACITRPRRQSRSWTSHNSANTGAASETPSRIDRRSVVVTVARPNSLPVQEAAASIVDTARVLQRSSSIIAMY